MCSAVTRHHKSRHSSAAAAATTPLQPRRLASLVLRSTVNILPKILRSRPTADSTPSLVSKTLKLLWNDSPKSLLFFESLVLTYPSSLSLSFNLAIDVAARSQQFSGVTSLFCRMWSMGVLPTLRTLSIVMKCYVSAGKPERAIKVFTFMLEHGGSQDLHAFNTLLDVLCKAKRVEMAWDRVFKDFARRFGADCVSHNIITNGWCLVKRVGKALEMLLVMVRKGIEPSSSTYNVVLKGFFRAGQGRAGQVEEGRTFFLKTNKRNGCVDVVSYTTVVKDLGVAGDARRAGKVFDEMTKVDILPSVAMYTHVDDDGCRPNVQTYNVIIRYFSIAGEIESAVHLFKESKCRDYCLPNLDTNNIPISSMFVRKRSEDLALAGKMLAEMVERGFRPRRFMFNRVRNRLILTGNQGFAQEILRMESRFGNLPLQFK